MDPMDANTSALAVLFLALPFAALIAFCVGCYLLMRVWLAWDWGKSEGYWPHPYPDIGIEAQLTYTPRWLWPLYHRAYRAGQAKRERERKTPADPRIAEERKRILGH